MKFISIIFLFITTHSYILAQADSIVAENIFNYELANGRATRNRIIIKQNTFDLNNKLIRQVYYDSVANIKSSTLYFYDGDLLLSEETYGPDFTIDSVRRFFYNSQVLKENERLYLIQDGMVELISQIRYSYSDKKLVGKTVYLGEKKWITKSSFNKEGDTLTIISNFKKGTNSSGAKERTEVRTYDEEKPVSSQLTTVFYDKSVQTRFIEYEYDTVNNRLISEKLLNDSDSLLREIVFQYYPTGAIRSRSTRLSSGDYIEHHIHERRDHFIVVGKPDMYAIPDEN